MVHIVINYSFGISMQGSKNIKECSHRLCSSLIRNHMQKKKKCMIGACPAHLIACGCLTFKIVGPHNLVGLGTPHPGSFWPKYPVFRNFQFQKLKIFLLDISFYLILMSYIPLIFPRNIRHSINF